MFHLFKKSPDSKPPYLDRIDELAKVDIIRLKGKITHDMIPLIEARIKENRRHGGAIDKNVIVDFSRVIDVDSATIAFHLEHLKEYHEKGFQIAFIHVIEEFLILIQMYKQTHVFTIYKSEEEAVKVLNK